jgi:hypothetical protein
MMRENEKSNAQAWELEVTCRSKKYLDAVVLAILKYGMIDFEVETIEFFGNENPDECDGRYTVLMWCSWFSTLKHISTDLALIEEQLEDFKS